MGLATKHASVLADVLNRGKTEADRTPEWWLEWVGVQMVRAWETRDWQLIGDAATVIAEVIERAQRDEGR
jgi:hypothetical protein